MKLIERKFYLNKLLNVKGTPDIKVITGIRRSGKSKLLESYMEYLKENEENINIIYIDFTKLKYETLKEYHKLNEYIENNYIEGKNNYIFVDEVQMCPKFELAINSLHSTGNYDIYITGSNAFLLSSDLATLFTGRTFAIEVFPFSLKEFMEYYNDISLNEAFERYVFEGGMAGSYAYNSSEEKYAYINEVFETLIVRDIRQKYGIKNTNLMNKIAEFLMDNISNLSSARKIADVLTNNNNKITHKTVVKYMEYLCNAFAFYKVKRYDIQGKKYLTSHEKYYLSDHSFRFAKLGTKNLDYGRIYENIVATELLRRGYEIYVGTLFKKEIDFVAIKQNEKIYIQVSDDISNDNTFKREVEPLLNIKDGYSKIIIANTKHPEYQYEGVKIVDIANWLTQE